jgi:ribosomal protein S27AE
MTDMPRIKTVWAFVVVDPKDGNEGIISMTSATGLTMPLIASDRVRLDSLRPYAQRVANKLGVPVQLVEFQTRVELETLEPRDRICPKCGHELQYEPPEWYCVNCDYTDNKKGPGGEAGAES